MIAPAPWNFQQIYKFSARNISAAKSPLVRIPIARRRQSTLGVRAQAGGKKIESFFPQRVRRKNTSRPAGALAVRPQPSHKGGAATFYSLKGPHSNRMRPLPMEISGQKNFFMPSVAASTSALMVTVNLIPFFSPKASSQLRNSSVFWSIPPPTILHRLSTNTWEMS